MSAESQASLFPLPPGARQPRARVIVLAGPSGSGKTSLTQRLGLPALSLDNFYRDDDAPHMPRRPSGLIDWDNPASWNRVAALEALTEICLTGRAEVPVYDIPTNRRTGTRLFDVGAHDAFIVEGIFASLLVRTLEREGFLLAALCIARSPLRNAWFRLHRDLGEARKPVPVLLWRGARLTLQEPALVRRWVSHGCTPMRSLGEARRTIEQLTRWRGGS